MTSAPRLSRGHRCLAKSYRFWSDRFLLPLWLMTSAAADVISVPGVIYDKRLSLFISCRWLSSNLYAQRSFMLLWIHQLSITLSTFPLIPFKGTLWILVKRAIIYHNKRNQFQWHSVEIPSMGVPQLLFVSWGFRKIWSTIWLEAVECGGPVLWTNLCLHWV